VGYFLVIGLILSVISYTTQRNKTPLSFIEKIYILSLFAFFLVSAYGIYRTGGTLRDFDSISRFILIIPFFLYIRESTIRPKTIFLGISIACIIFGINTIALTYFDRSFFAFTEHAGIVSIFSITLGISCFFLINDKQSLPIKIYLLFAGSMGVLTSLYSGGRGAWLASMLTLLILFFKKITKENFKNRLLAPLMIIVLLLTISNNALISNKINKRLITAYEGFISYFQDSENIDFFKWGGGGYSVMSRLEMYKSALLIISNHPFFGVGHGQFKKYNKKLIEEKLINKSIENYDHPHSQFLSTGVELGIFGIVILMFLLICPILASRKIIKKTRHDQESILLKDSLLILTLHYIFYAFSNAVFAHQSMVLFYAFMVAAYLGLMKVADKELSEGYSKND